MFNLKNGRALDLDSFFFAIGARLSRVVANLGSGKALSLDSFIGQPEF